VVNPIRTYNTRDRQSDKKRLPVCKKREYLSSAKKGIATNYPEIK
jgi:hypothetical protein